MRSKLFYGGIWRGAETIARIGRLRPRKCAFRFVRDSNKSSRGRRSPSDVAMTTRPSKSARHPSHPREGWERVRERERQKRAREENGKGPSGRGGKEGERGDNGDAKSGDLQGARRLVGSLFQRQVSAGKRIA